MPSLIALFVFLTLLTFKIRMRRDLDGYSPFTFAFDFTYAFLGMMVFNHYFN